jgi:hypothetical protein
MQRTKLLRVLKPYIAKIYSTNYTHIAEISSAADYINPSVIYLMEADESLKQNIIEQTDAQLLSRICHNPAACFLITCIAPYITTQMQNNYGGIQYYDVIKQEFDNAKNTSCFRVHFNHELYKTTARINNAYVDKQQFIQMIDGNTALDEGFYHPYLFCSKLAKYKPHIKFTRHIFMLINNPGSIRFIEKNMRILDTAGAPLHNTSFFY